jgi:hypothetical protein
VAIVAPPPAFDHIEGFKMTKPFNFNDLLTPGLHFLSIGHDDGCLTIESQREEDCTCASITLSHHQDEERFIATMEKNRAQRRAAEAVAREAIRKARKAAKRKGGDV